MARLASAGRKSLNRIHIILKQAGYADRYGTSHGFFLACGGVLFAPTRDHAVAGAVAADRGSGRRIGLFLLGQCCPGHALGAGVFQRAGDLFGLAADLGGWAT